MKRILQNHKGLHCGVNIFASEKVFHDSYFYCFEVTQSGPCLGAEILRGKL